MWDRLEELEELSGKKKKQTLDIASVIMRLTKY